jgi:hypothetical protein
MVKRVGCAATIAITLLPLFACQPATPLIAHPGGSRLLTGVEMDQISAGSAIAISNAEATAVGLAGQTLAHTNTFTASSTPVPTQPFTNVFTLSYASLQAAAIAVRGAFNQASGAATIAVDGVAIVANSTATAAGSPFSGSAQINMQFYALSIGTVDVAFGSATATACCAPSVVAQTTATAAGSGYSQQIQSTPIATVSGQVQSQVDIAVVSSPLPMLGAGQAAALTLPWWHALMQ